MSATAPDTNTVTLTIDGESITVPQGTLLIRAAEQLGVIIPRFCDHPLLDPVGACRQCMVEVEGQRKPMTACTTTCQDGMEVRTHRTSDVATKAQQGQLEFLLINHPLDCPMCDKGGECPLQDQALAYGNNTSRFVDEKRKYAKPVAVSPQILLDRERCVLCARCTRFSDQISGDPFIELFERGALEQVAIYEDEPYESYFSGNVIQICPVGALTSASYRFRSRPFDLRSAPSVCDHCSAGCTLTVNSRRGDIQRQLARTNLPVNEMWSCDKGRFGFNHLHHEQRVTTPLVRDGDDHVPTSWSQALTTVTRAIADANEAGPGRVAVLTGSRLADEDAYAVSKYVRTVLGTDDLDFRTRPAATGEDEALAALAGRATATYADVEHAPVTLVVGLDPEEEVPILHLRLRKAWRKHNAKLVPVGARSGSLERYAWRRLAGQPGTEGAALAAVGRALGVAGLAEQAAATGYDAPHLEDVVDALRDADGEAVVLVGERAGGALSTALALADAGHATVAWVPRRAGARGALDAGLAAGFLPGGRRLDDDDDRAAVAQAWGADLPSEPGRGVREVLEAAAGGDIDVLHLIGVDLVRDFVDPDLARRALDAVGTVVVQDLARTATTAHADVVLPAVGTQERRGSYTDWEGRTQRFSPCIDPPELAQQDWEIVVQLAALQGRDLGFSDLDALRTEVERLGRRESPRPLPAPPAAAGDAGDDGEGLVLVTYPLLLDRGTMLAGADDLNATAKAPRVALHPTDAERLGLEDGATVTLVGTHGELTLPVQVDPGTAPGTAFVPANSTEVTGWSLGDRVAVAQQEVSA